MTNTVLIKRSSTANSVPTAGQLLAGELAINYADGNLFYKNSSNVVTTIASNKFVSVTGNITGGNLNAVGLSLSGNVVSALVSAANITTTANIAGSFFIGNGSQLTGIASSGGGASIANGTSNVNINTSGGDIAFSVAGTANVVILDNAGWNYADTTTQDTGINLGRIQTSVQGWNLP